MNIETIQSNFQFIGNTIRELNIHNDFVNLPKEDAKREFDVSYDIESITIEDNEAWGIINLYVNCSVTSTTTDDDDKPDEYEISLVLNGCFKDDITNEDKFKEMLEINGCAVLYSIARSIITSVSSLTLFDGSITLPMINVFEMIKKD